MNSSYVDELERQLADFSSDWEQALSKRVFAWRVRLLSRSCIVIGCALGISKSFLAVVGSAGHVCRFIIFITKK